MKQAEFELLEIGDKVRVKGIGPLSGTIGTVVYIDYGTKQVVIDCPCKPYIPCGNSDYHSNHRLELVTKNFIDLMF